MTAFDYGVLAVIALSVLLGLWRGVVGEVLALTAWVAGFFAARAWAGSISSVLVGVVSEPSLRYAVAFVLVLLVVLLAFAIARILLRTLLKAVGLGFADRLLGAVFGIARGVLIVFVVVLIAGMTSVPKADWWQAAWLAPPIETAVIAAKPWLPSEVAKRIRYR